MADDDFNISIDESVFKRKRPSASGAVQRKHYRHPLHWRVAIVDKSGGQHDIYHGRTHDLSLGGASILIERNVYFTEQIVILLAVPPMHQGQKEIILEIESTLLHTVLDSVHGMFRLGMKFVHFKGDGKRILSDILSKRHIPQQDPNPYYRHRSV